MSSWLVLLVFLTQKKRFFQEGSSGANRADGLNRPQI